MNSQRPKVSVILPIYNPDPVWLQKSIDSVLSQSYENIEIVIVNDGSEEEASEYISENHQEQIDKIIKQTNQGFTGASNRAIEEAEGDFIAPIGQDDIWFKNKIEKQIESLDIGKICLSRAEIIDTEGNILGESPNFPSKDKFFDKLISRNFIRYEGSLIAKDVFNEYDVLDEKYTISDYDLWLKVLPQEDFILIDEPTFQKRTHDSANSNLNQSLIDEEMEIIEEYIEISHKYELKELQSKKLRRFGKRQFENGKYKIARRLWFESFYKHPNLKSFFLLLFSHRKSYDFVKKTYSRLRKYS